MKKLLSLILATMLLTSAFAFAVAESEYPDERILYFGECFNEDHFATSLSNRPDPRLDEGWDGDEDDVLGYENLKAVEAKYNVKMYNRLQGDPEYVANFFTQTTKEFDIVHGNGNTLLTWARDGFLVDLKSFLPEDHDIFTTGIVGNAVDVGLDGVYFFRPHTMDNTYLLACNVNMLEDANLEDPRELYKRGEWTWDVFLEYCEAMTKDIDGDGVADQFGYSGHPEDTIDQLIMSNGGVIIGGPTATFNSTEVTEAMEMVQEMYLNRDICYPYNDNWHDDLRFNYTQGIVAFSPMAVWMLSAKNCYDPYGGNSTATFETILCPWPVGPSGNHETNAMVQLGGDNYVYCIPTQAEDPERIFNAWYDQLNWHKGDLSKRDNPESSQWWVECTSDDPDNQDANWFWQNEAMSRTCVELHRTSPVDRGAWIRALFTGSMTPAQIQETYQQQYQDFANTLYVK